MKKTLSICFLILILLYIHVNDFMEWMILFLEFIFCILAIVLILFKVFSDWMSKAENHKKN